MKCVFCKSRSTYSPAHHSGATLVPSEPYQTVTGHHRALEGDTMHCCIRIPDIQTNTPRYTVGRCNAIRAAYRHRPIRTYQRLQTYTLERTTARLERVSLCVLVTRARRNGTGAARRILVYLFYLIHLPSHGSGKSKCVYLFYFIQPTQRKIIMEII